MDAHGGCLSDLATELCKRIFDLLACDMLPWGRAHAFPLAVISVRLAPEQTRGTVFLERSSA
jgi:hypothetical protein